MKIYIGIRDGDDCFVRVCVASPPRVPDEDGGSGSPDPDAYLLPGRPDSFHEMFPELPAQSPPSFRWAEVCGGTDHLALAIAVDVAGEAGSAEEAADLLSGLPFFRRFLSRLPPDGFEISDAIFIAMLKAVTADPPDAPRVRRRLAVVRN